MSGIARAASAQHRGQRPLLARRGAACSSSVARSAAAAASARRHVLEAGRPLVDAIVPGERVAPAGRPPHEQHPDARRTAPLVRRRSGGGPTAGERQPTGGRARVDEQGRVGAGGHLVHRLADAHLGVGRLEGEDGRVTVAARAADERPRSTRPARSTRHGLDRPPRPACQAPACSTAECSTAEASSGRRGGPDRPAGRARRGGRRACRWG